MNIDALSEFFYAQATEKQKLGTIDCVNFVAEALFIGWDRDYRDILQYNSRRTAVNRLRELGGLKAACNFAMGSEQSIYDLQIGDVVWFDKPATIGLLMPGYIAVKLGKAVHRLQVEEHMTGWRTNGR